MGSSPVMGKNRKQMRNWMCQPPFHPAETDYKPPDALKSAYSQLYHTVNEIAGTYIDNQLSDFEETFAPVPLIESNHDGKLIEASGGCPSTAYPRSNSTSTDVEGFIDTAFFGTDAEWTTGIDEQRAISAYGTCKFGVQNDGVTGDATDYTGG
ncbi:glycoside hydrolase family 18 protein [Penicillium verhagenii]|nr:glycoside hydrolase family 18 protein [Penicillium verhagenii]